MPRGVPRARDAEQPGGDDTEQVSVAALAVGALDGFDESASAAVAKVEEGPSLFDLNLLDGPLTVDEVPPTAEQLRIKDLENLLAMERGRKDVESEVDEVTLPGGNGNVLIHFLEDGLSALGHVWYRGQELEFAPDSQAYKDTFDRRGRSWLDMRGDDFAQVQRWGKVMFREGPWPGLSLRDAANEPFLRVKDDKGRTVPPPTEADLVRAETEDAKRRRVAPKLPTR